MPNQRKAAVSKLYHVRAFEVSTDRSCEFDVVGLNNLPYALSDATGTPRDGRQIEWEVKIPQLRNSLSYHNGRHGVISMGPFRVYVERDAKDAPHEFTAELKVFAGHGPDEWDSAAVYDVHCTQPAPFRELMARIVTEIQLHLNDATSLRPRDFAGWVRVRVHNGYPDSKLYFSAAGRKYTAHLKVTRHDTRAV